MIGKWFQDALQQWRQNPRLRYAVLIVLVILAMHGVLKIADRRDEVAKAWAHDQGLMTRYREVAAEPDWPKRSAGLMQQWRDSVALLPHASTMGAAKAEQQVWLSEFASSNKFAAAKITVQDALDVPGHPGMIQVVSRIDVDGVAPWLYAVPLREVATALPWRQVQRAEITAVNPGKLSLTFRNFYRNDKFAMPPPLPVAKTGESPAAAPVQKAATEGVHPAPVVQPATGKEGVLKQVLDTPRGTPGRSADTTGGKAQ